MEAPKVTVTVLNVEDILAAADDEVITWKVAVEFPEVLGTGFAKHLLEQAAASIPEEETDVALD